MNKNQNILWRELGMDGEKLPFYYIFLWRICNLEDNQLNVILVTMEGCIYINDANEKLQQIRQIINSIVCMFSESYFEIKLYIYMLIDF